RTLACACTCLIARRAPRSPLSPYTTLFRSQGQMMELAAALEAHRAKNFTYAGASISGLTPHIASNQHYNHVLALGGGNLSFTITSTPTGSLMSGMPTLTLDNDGNTSW